MNLLYQSASCQYNERCRETGSQGQRFVGAHSCRPGPCLIGPIAFQAMVLWSMVAQEPGKNEQTNSTQEVGQQRQVLPFLLCQERKRKPGSSVDKVHLCFLNHASFAAPKIFQNCTTILGTKHSKYQPEADISDSGFCFCPQRLMVSHNTKHIWSNLKSH